MEHFQVNHCHPTSLAFLIKPSAEQRISMHPMGVEAFPLSAMLLQYTAFLWVISSLHTFAKLHATQNFFFPFHKMCKQELICIKPSLSVFSNQRVPTIHITLSEAHRIQGSSLVHSYLNPRYLGTQTTRRSQKSMETDPPHDIWRGQFQLCDEVCFPQQYWKEEESEKVWQQLNSAPPINQAKGWQKLTWTPFALCSKQHASPLQPFSAPEKQSRFCTGTAQRTASTRAAPLVQACGWLRGSQKLSERCMYATKALLPAAAHTQHVHTIKHSYSPARGGSRWRGTSGTSLKAFLKHHFSKYG